MLPDCFPNAGLKVCTILGFHICFETVLLCLKSFQIDTNFKKKKNAPQAVVAHACLPIAGIIGERHHAQRFLTFFVRFILRVLEFETGSLCAAGWGTWNPPYVNQIGHEFNSSRLYTLSARLNALHHIVSCSVCPLMVCRQSTVSLMLTLNPNHFVEGVYQIISLLVESRGSLMYRIVTLENRIFFLNYFLSYLNAFYYLPVCYYQSQDFKHLLVICALVFMNCLFNLCSFFDFDAL